MGWADRWPPLMMWLFITYPRRLASDFRSNRFFQSIRAENTAMLDICPLRVRVSTSVQPK